MKKILMSVAGIFMNLFCYAIPQQPVQEDESNLLENDTTGVQIKNKSVENITDTTKEKKVLPEIINNILAEAKTHLGKRYVWATRGPKTFDCSGFVYYVFKQFGYTLSPSSRNQYTLGAHVTKEEVREGDLIFFRSRRSGKKVGHVGIVYLVEGDIIHFIHASLKGVRISRLDEKYYTNNFVGFKRIIQDN